MVLRLIVNKEERSLPKNGGKGNGSPDARFPSIDGKRTPRILMFFNKKSNTHGIYTTGIAYRSPAGILQKGKRTDHRRPVQRGRHQHQDLREIEKKEYATLHRLCRLFCVLQKHLPPEELGEITKEATEYWGEGKK